MLSLLANKWVLMGVASVTIVGIASAQTWRLGNAKETIGKQRQAIQEQAASLRAAESANEKQTATISELRDRVAELIEARQAEARQREEELTARDRALTQALADAEALRREIDEEFGATHSCASLRDLRVDVACPVVAGRLRERTDYSGGDGD